MTRGANRADGFRIVKGDGLPFIRSPRMRPMCATPLRGTIDEAGLIVTVKKTVFPASPIGKEVARYGTL